MQDFNISNIAEGALVEQVDREIKKVLENILDVNTSALAKRKINITLTFVPGEERDVADISFQTKSTLAPVKPVLTRIAVDRANDGSVIAEELRRGAMVGQVKVDVETGEVLEPAVKNKGNKLVSIK